MHTQCLNLKNRVKKKRELYIARSFVVRWPVSAEDTCILWISSSGVKYPKCSSAGVYPHPWMKRPGE